jgi:TP901 family phage tail tape measure protein
MAAITLDVGANTRRAERDIQKLVNRSYNINLRTKGDQPLGRITGKVNEFTKSLDASNARVIAFGASAGIIFGLERAFSALVSSTIEVQKSLQDINVILNVSAQNLQKFGSELFNIAKNTGQSFQAVATAATEFSRQGLGVEETLKRTNEALILSRLSGLDTAKSVEALTAAVNSFASQAVTATEVVNKFANVDAAFAVSSADLAEALARVGSSAAQSGVSLNELIAIVTSAQQTTARGGAVIGNSFKTIFTRLQRGKVVNLLGSLGISETDSSGQLKSTIQLLQDLGKVYDTLGARQQAAVAEQVGGVFQINILKAALADLGKEYSIYSSALNVAAGTTDQAIRRNEELNKTYAAQLNALQENARQLAAAGGERLLGPSIDRLVGGTNTLLSGFSEADGQGVGAVLGKGILDGLGQFIAGPGLVLIGGVLLKLFRDLAKFATGSVQQLLGLNTAATQQRDLQASIQQILSKNPQLLELALKSEQGLNTAANSLLASLQKQTVELQKQAQVAAQISKAFVAQAGVRVAGGVPVVPTGRPGKAAGYIPNFASDKLVEKYTAISLGATQSVRPMISQGTIGGRKFVMNNQEVEFPGVGKNGDSMVLPTYGDGPKIAAAGFIPNFAPKVKNIDLSTIPGLKSAVNRFGVLYPQGGDGIKPFSQPFNTLAGLRGRTDVPGSASIRLPYKSIYPITKQETNSVEDIFDKSTDTFLSAGMTNLARDIADTINRQAKGEVKAKENRVDAKNLPRSTKGIIFETAVKGATRDLKVSAKEGDQEAFDFDPINAYPALQGLFGFTGKGNSAVEAKIGESAAKNIPNKILNQYPEARKELFKILGLDKSQTKPKTKPKTNEKALQVKGFRSPQYSRPTGLAAGFIPNFAAIAEVMGLETAMSGEKAIFDTKPFPHVRNKSQPTFGSAMADHGGKNRALKDSMMGQKRAGLLKSSGYIPNFAIENPDTQAAGLGTAIGAITAQLTGLAFAFAFSKDQVKTALNDLTASTKAAASAQRNQVAKDIKEKRRELQAQSLGGKVLTPAEQKEIIIQNAKTLRQDETLAPKRASATQAAKPSFGAKTGAFLDTNAFALAIAAPIIGETIKNLAGTETKTARTVGAVGSGLGQAGSFAATGELLGGVKGAAIGTVVGAILAIPEVVNQLVSDVPELTKAANLASQELTKFSEAGARYFTSFEKLNKAISSEGDNSKLVDAARQEYIKALSDLSASDQKALTAAEKLGTSQEKYAELLEEKIAKERGAKAALDVGQAVTESITDQSIKQYLGGIPRLIGKGFNALDTQTANIFGMQPSGWGDSIIEAYTPESGFDPLSANAKVLERSFLDLALGGKSGAEAITRLDEILQAFVGPDGRTSDINTAEDLKQVLSQEKILGTQDEGSRRLIEQLTKRLDNLTGEEEVKKAITEIIAVLRSGSVEAREKNVQADTSEKEGREEREKRVRVAKEEQAAINGTISEIQKNIAIQNLWRSSLDNLNENMRGFFNNLKIEQQLTQPRQTLEDIIGADKAPVRRLAAQEGLAGIQENQRAGISGVAIGFKDNVRSILEKPFQENIDKLIADLKTTGGAFANRPEEDIRKDSKEVQDKSREQFSLLNQTMGQVEGYMSQFVTGQISTQQLLEQSRAALSGVGIDVSRGTQASNDIERAVAELEAKSIQEQVKAFQQRTKLASETKQAILQSKIQEALGVFGGFEGFMNRPEEEQNYIQKITGDLDKVKEIRSMGMFRYGNVESVQSRTGKEGAAVLPDLGRSFSKIFKELIDQSGGAFRSYIQKSIDEGPQLTGFGAMGGRDTGRGGFDDIVAGRAVDIENQLKLAEDRLKIETDPVSQKILQGFIDSIRNAPGGIRGTAELQTSKEFGVARQSTFKKIFDSYDSAAFQELEKTSPDLAKALGDASKLTDDPLLNEASNQTAVQTKILEIINKMANDAGIETGFDSSTLPSTGTEKILQDAVKSGAMPVLTEDQTKIEADKKVAQVQNQTLPPDNRSTAQIEAETIAKRDQARKMGLSFQDFNTQYPNGLPKYGPEPSPDYAKYQELNRPGQVFESFDDVLKNWAQRDTFKRTGQIPDLEMTTNKPAAPISNQQSFTQQEAAFNTNTSALTSLAGGIENLNSTISSFETSFSNLNNVPGAQQVGTPGQATVQPNITTTTSAPVSVTVQAEAGTDIATAVGEAVKKAIPEIVLEVRRATGEKIPPTTPSVKPASSAKPLPDIKK